MLTAMILSVFLDVTQPKPAPVPVKEATMTGVYFVTSKDGTDVYTGTAIVRKLGESYIVVWTVQRVTEDGIATSPYTGIGLRDGNKLSIGWAQTDTAGKSTRGVTVMTLGAGGTLAGQWMMMPGAGRAHTETWELLRPLKEE